MTSGPGITERAQGPSYFEETGLTIQEFAKLVRARWLTVTVTVICSTLLALAISLLTTPQYKSTTRLFVSTTAGASAADLYQANRLSQERVLSYTQLLMGQTLAQRTVSKLNLDVSADDLQSKIKASAKPDTVLIDVSVLDASAVRARDIANALSDEFVTMVQELETPKAGANPDARVVVQQRALIASRPVIPKTGRNIAIGLLLGTVLGFGLAVLRDMADKSVKDHETLERYTGVGLVGSIPLNKQRRTNPAIAFDKENSATSEAFRKIRTNLQFLSVDNPPRVIVITSSVPEEGKSTTAINIALALAEADHDVVLVDGDMRRPSLAPYLNLVGSVGFSTVLSGAAPLSDVLQKTEFPRLSVLTVGPTPPNPSELLASESAKKVLGELRARFDYVIIDSSPLLPVTDGAILAANADGALMVARFGHTKRDQLAQAVANLHAVDAVLLGAVLTMTPLRGHGSYSYHYDYYGSREGSHSAAHHVTRGGTDTA